MARVWALLGDKAGDNAQALALARAVGEPFVEKRLTYNALRILPNWLLGATTRTLTPTSREEIARPWPALVIAVGQRNVPVARAIRHASGGRTALVTIGRPRASLRHFNLVITTPQYGLPGRDNVLHLDLPYQPPDAERLAAAVESWRQRLPPDTRCVALLVGGNVAPYRFDSSTIDVLAEGVLALCRDRGTKLVVTCGRRLPRSATARLRDRIADVCAHFHTVHDADAPNPYLAYLAIADAFVVTTDSVSMMSDATSTQRPVHLFRPPSSPPLWWRLLSAVNTAAAAIASRSLRDALVGQGLVIPLRRTARVADHLVATGQACWLGDPHSIPPPSRTDPHAALLTRIRALLPPPETNP